MIDLPVGSPSLFSLRERMRSVLRLVRGATPLSALSEPASVFFLPSVWDRMPNIVPLVWIATAGCQWMPGRGCTMCNYGTYAVPFSTAETLASVERLLGMLGNRPLIHLAPAGSFFDTREVPHELRIKLLRLVAKMPDVLALSVESRPEFVTKEALREAVGVLRSGSRTIGLTVGMGLECIGELEREVCVNKGTPLAELTQAMELIRELDGRECPMAGELHVLLKPPLLTEAEAIDDAARAILWSASQGAAKTILMLNSVKEHTLCAWLAGQPDFEEPLRFTPPRLWSALEVLERVPEKIRRDVLVFGFASNTTIGSVASNCPACTPVVQAAILAFDHTGDAAHLQRAAEIPCPCKERWRVAISGPSPPLWERIEGDLVRIECRLGVPQSGYRLSQA